MTATTAPPSTSKTDKPDEPKDSLRDLTETIVFVVVLVLMLKLFVAEAFVIPTGSMAETLYGHHRNATCEQCGYNFPVNCSDEVEPQNGRFGQPVVGYCCPNCRYQGTWKVDAIVDDRPSLRSGDRVLVFKPEYHLFNPSRWDVPVFKYPKEPQQNWVAMNYIKRLIGLPGETIAIYGGDAYVARLDYPADTLDEDGQPRFPRPEKPTDLWRLEYTYHQNYDPKFLKEYDFRILRKPPHKLLDMARIVYDNDHQSQKLIGIVRPRWFPEQRAAWTFDNDNSPRRFTANSGNDLTWLRYQHLVPDWDNPQRTQPQPITNFLGYNSAMVLNDRQGLPIMQHADGGRRWVSDLIVECEVEAQGDDGEIVLELSKSVDRFQARFDLATGMCTLVRNGTEGRKEMAKQPTSVKGAGTYRLRLANVDHELVVWVGSKVIPFGREAEYLPPPTREVFDPADLNQEGWFRENDLLAPASVGVKGKATISHIKLWRDTYYTSSRVETYYVQPNHYFCLGDNSEQSADSRSWGLVPDRLMLGRALAVYFPIPRIGLIE